MGPIEVAGDQEAVPSGGSAIVWVRWRRESLRYGERRRGRAVVALCAGGLAFAVGCGTFTEGARRRLISANEAYGRGQHVEAIAELNGVLSECPSAPQSAEAYYLRGLCMIQTGRWSAGRSDLERALSLSKRSDLTAKVHATLGGLAFDAGRYGEANAHFAEAVRGLPESPPKDEVYYRYGVGLQREGRWSEARQQFSAVLHRYAGSAREAESRRRFSWAVDGFSIQCGVFGTMEAAERMAAELRGKGLAARRAAESRDGRPVFVVYVGTYSTYRQAVESLSAVRRVVTDALVVP